MRFRAGLLKKAEALLTKALLQRLFAEMDRTLRAPVTLEVTGGAAMVLLGIKKTTKDVDLVSPLPGELKPVISELEGRYRLQPGWINEELNQFEALRDPRVLWSGENLQVRGPGVEELFLTKASITRRDKDLDDVLAIVRHQGWNYEEAEKLFRSRFGRPLPQAVHYHLLYGLAA